MPNGKSRDCSKRPQAQGQALHHRHPAAQRHRLAAHGPCARQHDPGHAVPLRAHARARTCCGSRAPTMPASPRRWWSSASLLERQQADRRDDRPRGLRRARCGSGRPRVGGTIISQLRRLGASLRLEPRALHHGRGPVAAAVIKVFVELYKAGLIYRDKRLVNWDPKFQTAISDLEVRARARSTGKSLALSATRSQGEPDRASYITCRHHAARDDAGRHGGRGASRGRALRGT